MADCPRRPSNQNARGTVVLTDEERAIVRLQIAEFGETEAAKFLGVGRMTLIRALAGLSLKRGTALILGSALAAVRAAEGAR